MIFAAAAKGGVTDGHSAFDYRQRRSSDLAALLAAAYTAGLCAGKAAAHTDEDDEPKIYMDHTHGGED